MKTYRAAVIGCSRIGGFIDNEVVGSPTSIPPISHAAAFEASERTDLVACSDLREDVMEKFGARYNVPKERQYTDYEEMIAKEGLDIVSVATQPEHRERITVHAADHGVKAIYAEKAMAASMAEADSMEDIRWNDESLVCGKRLRPSVADREPTSIANVVLDNRVSCASKRARRARCGCGNMKIP